MPTNKKNMFPESSDVTEKAESSCSEEIVAVAEETTQSTKEVRSRRKDRLEKQHREVSFSDITVREYPITFGDNPATPIGPPLTIEWEYQSEMTVSVDDYEDGRPPRRCGQEMIIPSSGRHEMLMNAGFSRGEITSLTKDVNVARQRRKRTLQTLGLSGVQLLSEGLTKNAMNFLSFGRSKRKERSLLKPFRSSRTLMVNPIKTEPGASTVKASEMSSASPGLAPDKEKLQRHPLLPWAMPLSLR